MPMKSDQHRTPARQPDPLAQHGHRQRRDEQRRGECHRNAVCQRHVSQPPEEQRKCCRHQHPAQDVRRKPAGLDGLHAIPPDHQRQRHQPEQVAEKHDLRCRKAFPAGPLPDRIGHREHDHRHPHGRKPLRHGACITACHVGIARHHPSI
jgi:hypothetical protein